LTELFGEWSQEEFGIYPKAHHLVMLKKNVERKFFVFCQRGNIPCMGEEK